MPRHSLVAVLILLPLAANAATFKCRDAGGKTIYSDKPCGTGEILGLPSGSPGAADRPRDEPYRRPKPVAVPPLPQVPGLADAPIAAEAGAGIVVQKPPNPDPLNFLARCGALISNCVKPGERSLDACFLSAPRCSSAKPWETEPDQVCCPPQCWPQFEVKRIAGMAPMRAFDATLFGPQSCIPLAGRTP